MSATAFAAAPIGSIEMQRADERIVIGSEPRFCTPEFRAPARLQAEEHMIEPE